MLRIIKGKRGATTLAEIVVLIGIVLAVALASGAIFGSQVKQKASNTGVDINSLKIAVPVVTTTTPGTVTIDNTGSTGIPTAINIQ